jgi:DNA polymerase-3 subunit epsilon
MVKDAPTFKQVANEIKQFLDNCDLGGYNSNRFDIPMLIEEFLRAGLDFCTDGKKLIDVQKIFHLMEQRTLSAAYKFYCSKTLDNAHSAESDAIATLEILHAQVERYPQIGISLESILNCIGEEDCVDFARRMIKVDGVEIFNFGKHKGKAVTEVLKAEPQYYDWMMKGDFPMNTKQKLTEILNRTLVKKVN